MNDKEIFQPDYDDEVLKQFLDASLDGVQCYRAIRNGSGHIVDFEVTLSNKIACDIIGRSKEEMKGKRLLDLSPEHKNKLPDRNESLFDIYCRVVETGNPESMLFRFDSERIAEWFENRTVRFGDGFVVWFSVATSLVTQANELERLNHNLRIEVEAEIQKNREKDQALIQQAKLAAMGDMISAIAHQWRQPLHSIMLGVELLNEIISDFTEVKDTSEFQKAYEIIKERVEYLTNTIEDFQNFYQPSDTDSLFYLEEVILSSLKFYEGQLTSKKVEISHDCPEDLQIYGNRNQLSQVFLTLIGNAIDSLSNKNGERQIHIHAKKDSNGDVYIRVEDNGPGISENIRSRIFEPYFTTKGPASGTGMGLYIAKLIIDKKFNGHIQAEAPAVGATLSIRLPDGCKKDQ